jgi:hypothetical protein
MTITKRIALTAAAVAVTGAVGATAFASQAAKQADNTRPGWGYGDKNHIHTGPPGQSVNVSNVSTQTATTGSVHVRGNGSVGNVSSGSASNTNTTTTNVSLNK